jgi:hypothetical protein
MEGVRGRCRTLYPNFPQRKNIHWRLSFSLSLDGRGWGRGWEADLEKAEKTFIDN